MEEDIIKNADISPQDIEQLRISVGWESNEGKYDKALENTYAQFSVKKDNKLIAFARIVSDGVLYAFVVDLMVHPDFQDHGLGTNLLQRIVRELKNDGVKYVQVTFDPGLEQFYRESGFEIIEAGSIKNY